MQIIMTSPAATSLTKSCGKHCISIHLSLFKTKTKDDSLLFLIKKHNNNKTVGYNDKLAYMTFINKNE